MSKPKQTAKVPGGTDGTQYLRPSSVARKLDISVRTVRRWAAAGHLSPRKLSARCVVFAVSDVERLVEAARTSGKEAV